MKPLKPTMRENKRYLLIVGKDLKENVEKAILEYVGTLGYSKATPTWIKLEQDRGVLSINREAINEVRGSFAISNFNIKVEAVSGTLLGLRGKVSRNLLRLKGKK